MQENDIRPKEIFDQYLRLAQKDIITFFNEVERIQISCPACEKIGDHSFDKNGFNYCLCSNCKTLYVNPRPLVSAFDNYYKNSPSSKYWASTFYKKTAQVRRKKIWKPKAKMIAKILEENQSEHYNIVDIGGGYGIFAEEMKRLSSKPILIIEPAPHLAKICNKKGFKVIENFLESVIKEDLPEEPKCFTSFELFEHLHNPEVFLLNLNNIMQKNDMFIFTTLSGTGLDIQVLWENSPSVSPPHHLNFFNPFSIKMILERTGFKCVDIKTPGNLDLDILNNNKQYIKDRFWNTFIENSSDNQKKEWQKRIAESGFSSHIMVVCKKI